VLVCQCAFRENATYNTNGADRNRNACMNAIDHRTFRLQGNVKKEAFNRTAQVLVRTHAIQTCTKRRLMTPKQGSLQKSTPVGISHDCYKSKGQKEIILPRQLRSAGDSMKLLLALPTHNDATIAVEFWIWQLGLISTKYQ
jgi:hypothetical protein